MLLSFKELIENRETPVYKNNKTGQYVTLSKHVQDDRAHRRWWKNTDDPEFIKFIEKPLRYLANRDRNQLKFRDEWAVVSKDGKRALIISLRYNQKSDKNDSFNIMTILNSDAQDSADKNKLFINVNQGQKITLTESKQIYEILCYI